MRVPSEIRDLRWSYVDWERRRLLVKSPKTIKHEGGEERVVPIFPDLLPLLEARWDDAAEGDVYILPTYHLTEATKPGKVLKAAVKHAGVECWPRIWHVLCVQRGRPN